MTTYLTEKRYGMCAEKKNTERFGISPCIWCQDLPKEYKLRIRHAINPDQRAYSGYFKKEWRWIKKSLQNKTRGLCHRKLRGT